jgi:hypothetical protein
LQDEFPALIAHELVQHEAQPALARVRALAPQVCLRDAGLRAMDGMNWPSACAPGAKRRNLEIGADCSDRYIQEKIARRHW